MRQAIGTIALLGTVAVLAACNYPGLTTRVTAEPLAATGEATPTPSATTTPSATPSYTPSPTATPTPQLLRIAYVEANDVWAFETGETPVQVTFSGNVGELRLTSDGELIVYQVRDVNFEFVELRAAGFDGSDDRVLIDRDDIGTLYPLEGFLRYTVADFSLVPGTHQVLFNTRGVFEGPGLAKSNDLLALDADNGELVTLLPPGQGGDFTLSPDGTQLAIVRPDSISFAQVDGSRLSAEILTFTPVMTFSEYQFYPRPVWSPDGESVLVAIPGENPFAESPSGTLRQVPADGGSATVLASLAGDLFRPQGEAPLISPDGTSIAYLRAGAVAGEEELVFYRHATRESITYASGTIQWKGWSPDSRHFAYSSGSGLDLFIGEIGSPPLSLGSAASLRWIDEDQYLVLIGGPGAWTFTLGDLSAPSVPLGDLTGSDGGFVAYDFAR